MISQLFSPTQRRRRAHAFTRFTIITHYIHAQSHMPCRIPGGASACGVVSAWLGDKSINVVYVCGANLSIPAIDLRSFIYCCTQLEAHFKSIRTQYFRFFFFKCPALSNLLLCTGGIFRRAHCMICEQCKAKRIWPRECSINRICISKMVSIAPPKIRRTSPSAISHRQLSRVRDALCLRISEAIIPEYISIMLLRSGQSHTQRARTPHDITHIHSLTRSHNALR